jgi:hypothetical protein
VPLVRDVTLAVVPLTAVCAAEAGGLMEMLYPVTALPPVLAGAAQLKDADWSPATATRLVGAVGTVVPLPASDPEVPTHASNNTTSAAAATLRQGPHPPPFGNPNLWDCLDEVSRCIQ